MLAVGRCSFKNVLQLTCCKGQYPAAIYDPMERATCERPRILWAPNAICSRTMTEIGKISSALAAIARDKDLMEHTKEKMMRMKNVVRIIMHFISYIPL